MKGLDLSKLKKVSSNKDTSTFKHPDGHEIRIAHSRLQPKMRAELEKLPLHRAGGGPTDSSPPEAPVKNAQDMQKGATSGELPASQLWSNFKQGLGIGPSPTPAQKPVAAYAYGGDTSSSPDDDSDSPDKIAADAQKQAPVTINIGGQPSSQAQAYGQAYGTDPQRHPPQQLSLPDDAQGNAYAQAYNRSAEAQTPKGPAPASDAVQSSQGAPQQPDQSDISQSAPVQQAPQQTPSQMQASPQQQSPQQAGPSTQGPQPIMGPASSPGQQNYNDAYNQSLNDHRQEFAQQDVQFAQDLANGHITPETMGSLFAKKDTLGKIGTVFGMMLSGAGSGLAHQPNALLGLMQNEINNDLEAQKQSKSNAQNLISLNQQHELQKAQAGQMAAQTAIGQDALAHMKANRIAFQTLADYAKAHPEDQQAQQTLAYVGQGVDSMNSNIGTKAAASEAFMKMMGAGGSSQGSEQGFQSNNRLLRIMGNGKLAEDNESKHIPGFTGQASESLDPKSKDELTKSAMLDHQISDYMNFVKQNANSVDPRVVRQGRAMGTQLQAAYREAALNTVYRPGEQGLLDNVVPGDPTKFFPGVRVLPALQGIKQTNLSNLNEAAKLKGLGSYVGVGGQQSQPQQTQSQPQTKTVNGIKYMRGPNGQAIPVK